MIEENFDIPTDVFSICMNEWQIKIGNRVLPTVWNSQGAARAGLKTELKRMQKQETSNAKAGDFECLKH